MNHNAHHSMGPSVLSRRKLCPGSWKIEKDLPGIPNPYAEEGKMLHRACYLEIRNVYIKDLTGGEEQERAELLAGLTEEHRDLVIFALRKVGMVIQSIDNPEIRLEQRVQTLRSDFSGDLYYGTADVLIMDDNTGYIHVIDYKFGRTPVDHPQENLQIKAYALAAAQTLGYEKAVGHIIQPRLEKHDWAEYDDLIGILEEIEEIHKRVLIEEAPLVPGIKQCQFCKGSAHGVCPALGGELEKLAKVAPDVTSSIQTCDDGEFLSDLYDQWKIVKKLGSAVESRIKTISEEVGSCGRYTIKKSRGNRRIQDILKAWEIFGGILGQEKFLEICTVSVSSLEKSYVDEISTTTGISKKAAKEEFGKEANPVIDFGNDKISIVEYVPRLKEMSPSPSEKMPLNDELIFQEEKKAS